MALHPTAKDPTAKEFVGIRRPPDVNGHIDGHLDADFKARRHDSLVFDGLNATPKKNYKEFMVYDANQCYPEFIVEYKRI